MCDMRSKSAARILAQPRLFQELDPPGGLSGAVDDLKIGMRLYFSVRAVVDRLWQ
jgi:hypothetical protein